MRRFLLPFFLPVFFRCAAVAGRTLRAEFIGAAAFRIAGFPFRDSGDSVAVGFSFEKVVVDKEGVGVAEMAGASIECGVPGEDVPSGAKSILRLFATAPSANA